MKNTATDKIKKSKPQKSANIVLIGFMGAGKTSVAQILAEKMRVNWFDLDEYIEARENRSIARIIENLGETLFRELETDALTELLKIAQSSVIALGGGTWTIEENRRIINENKCETVWLDAPFDVCWQRITENSESRPLAKTKAKARRLFDERQPIYQTANTRIEITNVSKIDETATEIFNLNDKPKRKITSDGKTKSQL